MRCLCYFEFLMLLVAVCEGERSLERQSIIDKVNKNQSNKWKAGPNFNPSVKLSYKNTLLGVTVHPKKMYGDVVLNGKDYDNIKADVLETFDARTWTSTRIRNEVVATTKTMPAMDPATDPAMDPAMGPAMVMWTTIPREVCQTLIKKIYDQGHCASSWAIAAASVFSDRRCIYPNNMDDGPVEYSVQDILSCCTDKENAKGCEGGDPKFVFDKYAVNPGLVTEECKKLKSKSCDHFVNDKFDRRCLEPLGTDKCYPDCENSAALERETATRVISFRGNTVNMQREIQNFGPLVATFEVYEDFLSYKSGVYHHVVGDLLGYHAVKVIGWGEESGEKYWLAVNSWGEEWGDKGTFKIKRGKAECYFDNAMFGVDFKTALKEK